MREQNIIVGVVAVPAGAAQQVTDQLIGSGVKIIFNYSEALLDVPQDVTCTRRTRRSTCCTRSTSTTSPAGMRILLWHGYLLGGTGSNVYTRALAREWSLAGHDVVVFSQEPQPEQYDLGGADTSGRRSAGSCRSSCSTATRGSKRGCSRS